MWKNALLFLVSIVLSLAGADFALSWMMREPAYWKARATGVPYELRDRLDLVLAGREQSPDWFPAVPANTYLEHTLRLDGQRVIPLSGVPLARIVGCNEAGYYSTFSTDEAGFRNPRGTWPLKASSHVFLVGDSFTQGDCVRDGEAIAERLRQRHPEVVNLGVGGNGPLLELAAIREYVPAGRVRVVFWMYYEGNDLLDLQRDASQPLLARYLDEGFTQSLWPRQEQVNRLVRDFIERRMAERLQGRARVLPNLREAIWRARNGQPLMPALISPPAGPQQVPTGQVERLVRVIERARQDVSLRGGRLVFVKLPEHQRLTGQALSPWARESDAVMMAVRALGVPTLDMTPVMQRHPDSSALFPFGLKGHYNDVGYRLVADELARHLSAQPPAAR